MFPQLWGPGSRLRSAFQSSRAAAGGPEPWSCLLALKINNMES